MDRLTNRIAMPERENDLIVFTKGKYDDTIPAEMTHDDIRAVLRRLAEYEDLEERGLLLRLPCKDWMDIVFGKQETFFGIDENYIENPIREITVDSADRFTWYDGWKTLVLNGADENGLDWEFSPEDIGKTVFFTQAEAEQKLKEMNTDNGIAE